MRKEMNDDQDAFGHKLYGYLQGEEGYEIVERIAVIEKAGA